MDKLVEHWSRIGHNKCAKSERTREVKQKWQKRETTNKHPRSLTHETALSYSLSSTVYACSLAHALARSLLALSLTYSGCTPCICHAPFHASCGSVVFSCLLWFTKFSCLCWKSRAVFSTNFPTLSNQLCRYNERVVLLKELFTRFNTRYFHVCVFRFFLYDILLIGKFVIQFLSHASSHLDNFYLRADDLQ